MTALIDAVLSAMSTVAFLVLPVVTYLLFFRSKTEHHKLYAQYSIPGWNFQLKRWWAYFKLYYLSQSDHCVSEDQDQILPSKEEERMEAPKKLNREESVDIMMVHGCDHAGNSIHMRITRRRHRVTDVWLHVQLQDGTHYQLPAHPNTVTHNNQSRGWNCQGLKMHMCEPFRRWRITFNGLLRRGLRNDYRAVSEEDVGVTEHVRFSFIWTSCSQPVDCSTSWSPGLLSESLAREPWSDKNWGLVSDELGTGYDQWGVLHGTWSVDSGEDVVLYLRGLRQRRWGPDQALWLHRSVTITAIHTSGLMFTLTASSARYGLSHVVVGHVLEPKGRQLLVDQCDLSLPHLGEDDNNIPQDIGIRFTAGGKPYMVTVRMPASDSAVLYGGWPWNYKVHLRPFQCGINQGDGVGVAHFWYRYEDDCPVAVPKPSSLLLEPLIRDHPLVVRFTDRECQSSNIVGGKGSSLALLSTLRDQVLVPPGLCLTVAAFQTQLEECSQLQKEITTLEQIVQGKLSGDLKQQCEKTVSLFGLTPVCATVKAALATLLGTLDTSTSFAVRSSAVGEDSEDLSAAGQNATFLGVHWPEEVLQAVQECWGSLFTFQSVQYRRQHGQPVKCQMGVVVQQMVSAHSAGVLFTRHPVTGDPRHILITANYGLGESVVSALVEPDTILLNRVTENKITIKEIVCGKKAHKITMTDVGGVITKSLTDTEATQISITEEQALLLGQLGLRVEAAFGTPRDIEWAISQEVIYLLQARPITSLDAWSDFDLLHEMDSPKTCDREVLSTANVGEVMPGATSPLSISTIVNSSNLATVKNVTGRSTTNLNIISISHNQVLLNTLLTTLYNVEDKLSLANKVMEMGIYGHLVITPEIHRLAIERNGTSNSLDQIKIMFKMLKWLINSEKSMKDAQRLTQKLKLDPSTFTTATSLYEKISLQLDIIKRVSDLHCSVSAANVAMEVIILCILLEGSQDFESEHYSDISLLLSTSQDVISADVPTALKEITGLLLKSGSVEEFCNQPPDIARDWLEKNSPEGARRLKQFLTQHGHRGIKEFDLMTQTWELDCSGLISMIQTMLRSSASTNHSKRETLTSRQTVDRLKSPRKLATKLALRWLLPVCRTSVARRENTKESFIKVIHKFRLAYRGLARLLVQEEVLSDETLVFFLTHYELGKVLETRDPVLINKAARRQRLWPQWERLKFPEISIGLPAPVKPSVMKAGSEALERVHGTPVYPGTVLGRACVILNLDEISNLQVGDVLITHSTDIGWTPYFPMLGGVVTELGGLISHGAVVAREYGLPCVIGAQGATSFFQTGDLVLLVGSAGTIDKIKPEAASDGN